jgi:hypothetical protein
MRCPSNCQGEEIACARSIKGPEAHPIGRHRRHPRQFVRNRSRFVRKWPGLSGGLSKPSAASHAFERAPPDYLRSPRVGLRLSRGVRRFIAERIQAHATQGPFAGRAHRPRLTSPWRSRKQRTLMTGHVYATGAEPDGRKPARLFRDFPEGFFGLRPIARVIWEQRIDFGELDARTGLPVGDEANQAKLKRLQQ